MENKFLGIKTFWDDFSASFSGFLESFSGGKIWVDVAEIKRCVKKTSESLEKNYKKLVSSMDYIFRNTDSIEKQTGSTVDLVNTWSDEGRNAPSMVSMCLAAFPQLCDGADLALMRPVLSAALLADVPNDLPYHNNFHFRKVLLHTVRLIVAHNHIFKGTRNVFLPEEIAMLLVSACIHDLGHQGQSNFIDRKYSFAHIEGRSFAYAKPFLEWAGLPADRLEKIRVMLLTTDVSPFGDPSCPSNQLRAAYEYHFGIGEENVPELTEELKILETDDRLCLLAMILHEADIMNSAGLDYDITIKESALISAEMGKSEASAEDTFLFLTVICQGRMVSDAAQFLAAENMGRIYNQVRQDIRDGKIEYRS